MLAAQNYGPCVTTDAVNMRPGASGNEFAAIFYEGSLCYVSPFIPANNPTEKPAKLLTKNWDGIGPEIGASDLDHNGNTDPDISAGTLKPGEKMSIKLEFRFLDKEEELALEKNILSYST